MGSPISAPGTSGRYQILSELGRGAMGVVYRARDRERECDVALKMLRNIEPGAIFRFKQEFRQLADVAHPNLVPLYELFVADEAWFFSMELVEGVDLLTYIRGAPVLDEEDSRATATAGSLTTGTSELASTSGGSSGGRASRRFAPPLTDGSQLERLRHVMGQLVDGVEALHEIGCLHRDLKPSNVLVADDGHVVILDFGIATTFGTGDTSEKTARLFGTPVYMAPEQAVGAELTEAADWYAVGVILYQALTGYRPFDGDVRDILSLKQEIEPLPPSSVGAEVPRDLEELCMDLLVREPGRRPGAGAIRRRLGLRTRRGGRHEALGEAESLLLARDRELATMHYALDEVRAGVGRTVYLSGRSGMGKSALLERFLDEAAPAEDTLVLSGRCFERESVPYKAFDSIVDALTSHLLSLPPDELWELLPEDTRELGRLFPVLRRVEAVLASSALGEETGDPREVRKRAFSALKTLLSRLAEDRALVIAIDDAQWGDADSAFLLHDLLRPPAAPQILTVVSYRSENTEDSPFLRTFLGHERTAMKLEIGPLSKPRARELAGELLHRLTPGYPEQHIGALADESGGNPFFLRELVQYVVDRRDRDPLRIGEISLEEVLEARVERLSGPARRLLDLTAVAGRPIPQGTVRWAADLTGDDRKVLARLRADKLVRTRGIRDQDAVEVYHDRIRQVLVDLLDEDTRRRYHRRLVLALERDGAPDPEELAAHLDAAGDRTRASLQYARAAALASEALAFDKAAALCERAIELKRPEGDAAYRLWARYGDALACAGRGVEAANAFQRAASFCDASEAVELQRRAGEQLLHCGHIDEGVELLNRVLGHAGVDARRSTSLVSLLFRRLLVRIRGVRFRPRDESQVPRETLTRLDALWTAAIGFGMTDNLRGSEFQAMHFLESMRTGERHRAAKAMCIEAAFRALGGHGSARAAAPIAVRALHIAREAGDYEVYGWATWAQALTAYQRGLWRQARDGYERGARLIREGGRGLAYEQGVVRLQHLWTLYYCGAVGELTRRVPEYLQDARERRDLYTEVNMCTGLPNVAWLVTDEADHALALAEDALDEWSPNGFHLQHYWRVNALVNAHLYRADGPAALEHAAPAWKPMKRAQLLRIPLVRMEMLALLARACVAAAIAAKGPERKKLIRRAVRAGRRCARTRIPGSPGQRDAVLAAAAALRGERGRCTDRLGDALRDFDEAGMRLHAAAALRRLGEWTEGAGGHVLIAEADWWMRQQSIVAPERMTAMLVPMPAHAESRRLGEGTTPTPRHSASKAPIDGGVA